MKKKRGREKGEGEGREFRPWAGHRSDCRTVAGPGAGHHARWPKKVPRAVEVTDGTVLQGCQRQVGVRSVAGSFRVLFFLIFLFWALG
ncbi:hypothetical protein V6Z11_A13G249800 [Gossypium hirsutum]